MQRNPNIRPLGVAIVMSQYVMTY